MSWWVALTVAIFTGASWFLAVWAIAPAPVSREEAHVTAGLAFGAGVALVVALYVTLVATT